jgi:hypothetical protein
MGSVRAAGLRHAWIRTATGYFDIDAVVSLEGDLEMDDTNVEGDDAILANFASKPTKSISITANSLTPEVLGAITGRTPTALSGTGATGQEIGMGVETNPPFVEVGGYTIGKLKATDANQTIAHIFHRVQLRMTSSPQEKDSEFNVEFEGTAYPTTKDVAGTALAYERIDTLRYTEQSVEALEALQA